jgi:hypothetical protein
MKYQRIHSYLINMVYYLNITQVLSIDIYLYEYIQNLPQ